MANPINPYQSRLFYDGPMTPDEVAEEHKRQQIEDAQEAELDAVRLGLIALQYAQYASLVNSDKYTPIEAWKMVTGLSEDDYHRQINLAESERQRQSNVRVINALRASGALDFMKGHQKTDDDRYPAKPQVMSREELSRRLREAYQAAIEPTELQDKKAS